MATNDFVPVAPGPGANVLSQSTYLTRSAVTTGYASGVAESAAVNKSLRQGTVMAAVLAQFIVDTTGQDALDDGTTATLLTNLKTALKGRLINIQKFSSSGIYTPTPGTRNIIIRAVGGGGGGGGSSLTSSTQVSVAGGGASGAYAECFIANPGTQVVTIGNPGTPGATGGNGGTGGTTSFGSILILPGGPGGSFGTPGTPPLMTPSASATTGGTFPAGTLVAISGVSGGPGIGISLTTVNGGGGGSNPFATGQQRTIGPGSAGQANGAGGTGAALGPSAAAAVGGSGAGGFMLIEEYL